MPTTNYWDSVNPLSILDVQPTYQQPINEIMNTLQKRTSYFMQGAQKFKNNYDNTEKFGFDLVNNSNKKEFETLNNDANTKLKDLSSSDLSISDNVNSAIDLYKPITNNKNFIYDQAVKTTADKTFNAAQSDAAKKNNTSGYNVSLVAYNKEMLDMFANDDPNKAKYYLNDKFLGTYWEAPSKVQMDLLKNAEKQFATTTDNAIKDPNNPYSYLQVKKTVIAKDDVKSYLMENRPEVMKNQNEVDARLQLLHAQKTLPPEQIQTQYKQLNDSLLDEKITLQKAHILDFEQKKLYVYKTQQEKDNADNYIKLYNKNIGDLEKQKKEYDYSAFTDKNKLQQGFDQASSLYDESHTNRLASSIARTVSESSQIKFDQGAYYSAKLVIDARNKIKNAKEDMSNPINRDGNANNYSTDLLPTGETNSQKGHSFLSNVLNTAVQGPSESTLNLIRGFSYDVYDGGKNINLVDYLKNNGNTKLGDLKQKMLDANPATGLEKYNQLLLYVKNAYGNNQDKDVDINKVPSSNKYFELLSLAEVKPRLQDLFMNPDRFKDVAHYQGNADFEKQADLVTNHNITIQEGADVIKKTADLISKTIKDPKIGFTPEQQKLLEKLPASDIIDIDKLASKVFDYTLWEKGLNRKLTKEEKAEIYNVITKPDNSVYYNEYGEAQSYISPNLQGIVQKLGAQNFDIFTRQSSLQFKSFDNLKKIVEEKIGTDGITPLANARHFAVTDKDKYNVNNQIHTDELFPLIQMSKSEALDGTNAQPQAVEAVKTLVGMAKADDYEVTFVQPKGSPDAYATINFKGTFLDNKSLKNIKGFDEVVANNGKIKLHIPVESLLDPKANIFARAGQDKDVMEIMKSGNKQYPLSSTNRVVIGYDKSNGNEPSISSINPIVMPSVVANKDGSIGFNLINYSLKGTNANSMSEINRIFNFGDLNKLLLQNPKDVFKRISEVNQAGELIKNLLTQYKVDSKLYYDENKNIDIKKLQDGLSNQLGKSDASKIIENIKNFLKLNTQQTTTFDANKLY